MLYGISKAYEPNIRHISQKLHQCSTVRQDIYLLYNVTTFSSEGSLIRDKQHINASIDRIINTKYPYNTNILYAIVDYIFFLNQETLDDDYLLYSYAIILNRKPNLIIQTNCYGFSALSTLLFGLKYYKDFECSEDVLYLLNRILYYTIASGYGKYFHNDIASKHLIQSMENESDVLINVVASTFVSSTIFDAQGSYSLRKTTEQFEDRIKDFKSVSGIQENPNMLDLIATLQHQRLYTSHSLVKIACQYRFWNRSVDKILCTNNSFANLMLHSLEAIKCIDLYRAKKIPDFVIASLFEGAVYNRTTELMELLLKCQIKDYIAKNLRYKVTTIIHQAAQVSNLHMVHLLKQAFYKEREINYIQNNEEYRVIYLPPSSIIYQNFIIYFLITHPVFEKHQNLQNWKLLRGVNHNILWDMNDPIYHFMYLEFKAEQKNLSEHPNINSIIARRKGAKFADEIDLLKYISTSLYTHSNIIWNIIYQHLDFLEKFNNLATINCIFQCLISNGCDTNKDKFTHSIIEQSVKKGYAKVVEALISIGEDCNHKAWCDDESMLLLAVKSQNVEVVRVLVKAGADLECRDKKNMTALMHCIRNFDLESFNILVEAGASQNFEGENREYLFTPAI